MNLPSAVHEAIRKEAEKSKGRADIEGFIARGYLDLLQESERKLSKPAWVGNTSFAAGVYEQLVIDRAQSEYEYQQDPERIKTRLSKFSDFQNRRTSREEELVPSPESYPAAASDCMARSHVPATERASSLPSAPADAADAAVVQPDGAFVGIWRDRESAEKIVNRSPSAKDERIRPMIFVDPA